MHRNRLLSLLDRYAERHGEEADQIERIRHLVTSRPHCFERHCLPGHVTASCWIVAEEDGRCLLTHHRKLGRWLQLGGHADGDPDPASAALREAREESGLLHFELVVRRRLSDRRRRRPRDPGHRERAGARAPRRALPAARARRAGDLDQRGVGRSSLVHLGGGRRPGCGRERPATRTQVARPDRGRGARRPATCQLRFARPVNLRTRSPRRFSGVTT